MDELVSVIVPVYGHEAALLRAIASIASQSYSHLEVIVVDDGSRPPVALPKRTLPFPCVLIHASHRGAAAARNIGAARARGRYLLFWDADVVAVPTMIEKMKAALEEHREARYAYSDFYFGKKKMRGQPFNSETMRQRNYIHTTSLIHRDAFPGFDESLQRFQDWDLWLTMAEQGDVGIYIGEALFSVAPWGTMSRWLPSFAYGRPWRWIPGVHRIVRAYEEARSVICRKHHL